MIQWLKVSIVGFSLLHSAIVLSGEVQTKKALTVADVTSCETSFVLDSDYQKSESSYQLNANATLKMTQLVAKNTVHGATLASNVYCQQLSGMSYTGSDQEWQGYFKNTSIALANKGAKNLKFTVIGTDDKAYKGSKAHREYKFIGDFNEGHQVIYNLALLDLEKNTMYTVSVSGDFKLEDYVYKEFHRIVSSTSL